MPGDARLAEMAMRFWGGDHEAVVAWLEALGCRRADAGDGTGYVLDGLTGIRCGLVAGGDPMAVGVQLGFLIAGPHWPIAFPRLQREINERWRVIRDEQKQAAAAKRAALREG